jgi:hypothetical protein
VTLINSVLCSLLHYFFSFLKDLVCVLKELVSIQRIFLCRDLMKVGGLIESPDFYLNVSDLLWDGNMIALWKEIWYPWKTYFRLCFLKQRIKKLQFKLWPAGTMWNETAVWNKQHLCCHYKQPMLMY